METTIHFTPQSKVSHKTDASSKANPSLPQIKCLLTLRVESSIISINGNITDNIIRKDIKMISRKVAETRMDP